MKTLWSHTRDIRLDTTRDTFKFIIPTIDERDEIGKLIRFKVEEGFTEILFERLPKVETEDAFRRFRRTGFAN